MEAGRSEEIRHIGNGGYDERFKTFGEQYPGIDIDYETIGQGNSMLMVATSGTAVVI